MLLECSCGKMFRVRDGTTTPPTKCPSCGGLLRPAAGGGAAAPAPAPAPAAAAPVSDARVKELEAKVAELEKAASAARASAEARTGELEEMAGRLAQAQKTREEAVSEGGRLKAELQKREAEIKDRAAKVQALEKEVQEARLKAQQAGLAALKEKDSELHYAQERIAALEGELRGSKGGTQSRDKSLADARARIGELEKELKESKISAATAAESAVREKDAEHKESQEAVARLGEELKKAQDAYKATLANKEKEIEELHTKMATVEKQLVEASARAQGGGKIDALLDQKNNELQRAQSRNSMLEKIVQDGEQRYRALQEEYHKASESAHTSTAAGSAELDRRDAKIVDLEAAVARHQARAEDLQKRLDAAAGEKKSLETKLRAKPAAGGEGNAGEARYLAADLDRSLGSISNMLQSLVERVKRLNQSLAKPGEEAAPAAPAGTGPTWGGRPAVEAPAPPDPLPAAEDVPAPEDSSEASEEAPAEAVELESLPDVAPAALDDGGLPQDETLLDLGGGGMGKKVREAMQKKRLAESQPGPEPEPEASEAAEEAPAGEGTFEEVPLSAETTPGPIPEDAPAAEEEPAADEEKPKKKGLFGKLFGRKK